jgi:uncharacterized RmlC-like cupin family protein
MMDSGTPPEPGYSACSRVRPERRSGDTAQTAGLARAEAISAGTVGSRHLWMGTVVAPAGKVSAVHHHGPGETGIYVLKGRATLFFGEGLRERLELQAGDFGFVPAWTVHAEGNFSGEDAEALIVRTTPEAIAVDLPGLRVPEDRQQPGD